jgi:hypothetical protein
MIILIGQAIEGIGNMASTVNFQIKGRWDSAVRFECEVDASLSYGEQMGLAVKAALKADANLAGADLAGANLARANLAGADLAGANLARANLADANLAGADLAGANLARADLAGANLARANLADANLADAYLADAYLARANLAGAKWRNGIVLTKAPIQIYGLTWAVTILDTHMQIGCELHSHDEWAAFDDRRIAQMDGFNAARFWKAHKDTLLALCAAHAVKQAEAD